MKANLENTWYLPTDNLLKTKIQLGKGLGFVSLRVILALSMYRNSEMTISPVLGILMSVDV